MTALGPDPGPMKVNGNRILLIFKQKRAGHFPTYWVAAVGSVAAAPNLQHDPI